MLAGDADTNCAIVGGLIGAYTGLANIDQEKVKKILESDHSKGSTKTRPSYIRPMKNGFDLMLELIALAP